jgi:hypothetical protein
MIQKAKKPRNKLKTFAFCLMGIFIGGLALRVILFFFGVEIHGIYSHAINYPIVGAILIYSGLQVYYKTKKHRLL